MPESVHDGFFLLSRASRNLVLPGSGIIVHPFLDADLILDLSDIKGYFCSYSSVINHVVIILLN